LNTGIVGSNPAISVRLRNIVRGGLGPIWAVSAIGWMDEEEFYLLGYNAV
jgi:hypothetical protein